MLRTQFTRQGLRCTPKRGTPLTTAKYCIPAHKMPDLRGINESFKTVKESVTVKQAAALYGLPVTTTWMTRCPFHEDHTPSMKLNDTYYYCFGCGTPGDVIDLTAQLFGLSSFQAARKLAQDFGLSPDKPPSGAIALPKPPTAPSDAQQEEISYCLRALHDYRDLLTRWQTEFAPLSTEEPLDGRFVEALHMMAVVDDLIDCLAYGRLQEGSRCQAPAGWSDAAYSGSPPQFPG